MGGSGTRACRCEPWHQFTHLDVAKVTALRPGGREQALAQCRLWLDENLPTVERVAVTSNAEGARRARDEQGTAAIAGVTAAEVYGLTVLAPQIEDRPDNTTRFFVLGRKIFTPSGQDRTTLIASIGDTQTSGALLKLLEPTVAKLGKRAKLVLAPDADHSFHVPARSGRNDKDVLASLLDAAARWMMDAAGDAT